MKVFRVALVVSATAIVKAEDEAAASARAREIQGQIIQLGGCQAAPVSRAEYNSHDLPELSLSPIAVCIDATDEPDCVYIRP